MTTVPRKRSAGPVPAPAAPRRTAALTVGSTAVEPTGPIAPTPRVVGHLTEPRECRTARELFDTFAAAFAAGDVDRIADCYSTPAYIVNNVRTVALTNRTEILEGFRTAREQCPTSGFASVSYEMHSETPLTSDLVEVTVRWCHRRRDSGLATYDSYRYLLRRIDRQLLIHLAIVVDGRPVPPRPDDEAIPMPRHAPADGDTRR